MLIFFIFGVFSAVFAADDKEEGWVHMPPGAKPAYMGIHGGTVPVSLLVSGDGASLFTFVGRTGDDFMEVLRKAHRPLPTLGNSTRRDMPGQKFATGLFAGNATLSAPVYALPASAYLTQTSGSHLQPFGLSDEPSSIEGEVPVPRVRQLSRSFRLFNFSDYFKPFRGNEGQ